MTSKEKMGKQSEVMSTHLIQRNRQTLFRHTQTFMQMFRQKMVNNHGSKFTGEYCLRRMKFFFLVILPGFLFQGRTLLK